jgi:phosphate transport system permease protein
MKGNSMRKKLLDNTVYQQRLWVHRVGITLSFLAMMVGLFFLLWILFTLFMKGFSSINLAMFIDSTPPPGAEGGGLLNAIVGSVMIVGVATLVCTPIGILAGLYLAEYGEGNWFAQTTRFITDIMLSAPSIVIGLFVYAIVVANTHHFSGWAGSVAISFIAIPIIVRTTDNMLQLVPGKVALLVRLRAVKAGIITGVLLAVARISGETAPLLFTALNNQFFSSDMNKPMANLPVVIYQFAMSPYENWRALAWGGALIITLSVLGLNILSRTVFHQKIHP